jgi:hypothetical protein
MFFSGAAPTNPCLTPHGNESWITPMKTQFLVALLGAAILVAGCYSTPDNHHRAGMPAVKDKLESKYERPPEQVFAASREVVKLNGTVLQESSLLGGTNTVRVLQGRVNECNVWVRIEPVDAKVTSVTVQVRTKAGGKDTDLMAEISKQIALQLAR